MACVAYKSQVTSLKPPYGSDLVQYNVRRSVSASEQSVGLVVVHELFAVGVEHYGMPDTECYVTQVAHRCGHVAFENVCL